MTQRINNNSTIHTHRPFNGEGVSLYAAAGESLRYRNLRVLGGWNRRRRTGWIKGSGGNHTISASVTKTNRVASAADPTASIVYNIPASFAGDAVNGVTTGIAGAASFQVSGDITARLAVGEQLLLAGSSANDGWYNVRATPSFAGGNTTIPVEEAISDGSIDGDVAMPVKFDVRKYLDDVENLATAAGSRTVYLDSSRDEVSVILGTAALLSQQIRAGGIVRLRFVYIPSPVGTQPTIFRAVRTAGPTSPADATLSASVLSRTVLELDTPDLSDSSAYTYTLQAENAGGTVVKELITERSH